MRGSEGIQPLRQVHDHDCRAVYKRAQRLCGLIPACGLKAAGTLRWGQLGGVPAVSDVASMGHREACEGTEARKGLAYAGEDGCCEGLVLPEKNDSCKERRLAQQ